MVSVLALPDDSPLLILDYGLLTVIGENVKELRRENRIKRRNHLIKGSRAPVLRKWLFKLHTLGKLYPEQAVVNLDRKKAACSNKAKMTDLIVAQDIPLSSLEHAYTISQKKNDFLPGDHVRVISDAVARVGTYGICSKVYISRIRFIRVNLTKDRKPIWDQINYLPINARRFAGLPSRRTADIVDVVKVE